MRGTLVIGCAHALQCDGVLPPINPDSVYDVHADGTVTDTRTSLMWKRCSEGQTWDGSTCAGSDSTFTWADALSHVLTLTDAGYDDWRLPNRNELGSLVEGCASFPAINTDVFPNTPSWSFWSASPHAYYSDYAWAVNFFDGVTISFDRSVNNRVRAVRGGQSFDSLDGACGSADGAASATEPAANLCSAGLAMSVSGSDDQWQWGCKGENGGADTAADACTADYASQALSISADPTSIVIGETSEITASSDAGLAVDLAASGACSLSGTTATGTAEGVCTITASQPGTGDTGEERYLAADDVSQEITVVTPELNIAVSKHITHSLVLMDGSEDRVRYLIWVENLSAHSADQVSVIDSLSDETGSAEWVCEGVSGGQCQDSSGTGDINQSVDLPADGAVEFIVDISINSLPEHGVLNTAVIDHQDDVTPENNTASALYQRCSESNWQQDPDDFELKPHHCIFRDSFEAF